MQCPANGPFALIEFLCHGFYLISKAAGIDINAEGFAVFKEFLQAGEVLFAFSYFQTCHDGLISRQPVVGRAGKGFQIVRKSS